MLYVLRCAMFTIFHFLAYHDLALLKVRFLVFLCNYVVLKRVRNNSKEDLRVQPMTRIC